MPIVPLNAAQSITELFILCGKNHVISRFEASTNRTFAISTIGINVKHAIDALNTNIDQKTNFPCVDCLGNAIGNGLTISLKKLI